MIGNVQKGGGKNVGLLISEPHFQSGKGLFSLISKGFQMMKPLLKKGGKILKTAVQSKPMKRIGKNLSNSVLDIASDALFDVIDGKNPSANLNTHLQKAKQNISKTLKQEIKRKINKDRNILEPPQKKARKRNKKQSRSKMMNSIL